MNATTFAALGEPSRLQIVEMLRIGPFSVGDIAEALAIRQPQVSKHLRVLSESGIVTAEPVARRRIYHLEEQAFDEISRWVNSFEQVWEVRLDSLGSYLDSTSTTTTGTTTTGTTTTGTTTKTATTTTTTRSDHDPEEG